MRFGVSLTIYLISSAFEQLEGLYSLSGLIEELGFDYLSVGHHVATPEGGNQSSPFVLSTGLAAPTRRLRLGAGIYILFLYHPAAVAEQTVTLEQMSNHRVKLRVSVGDRDYEFRGHGGDLKTRGARVDESITALRVAWTTRRWRHKRRFCTIAAPEVRPPTVQRRVAATRQTVSEAAMPRIRHFLPHCRRAGVGADLKRSLCSRIAHRADAPLEEYASARVRLGTADDVVTEVLRRRTEVGADYLHLVPSGPRLREMLTLFGKEVIPAVGDPGDAR